MNKVITVLIVAFIFAGPVQAGGGPVIEDLLITDLGEGFTRVEGSLVGIRFSDDEIQWLGCSIFAFKDEVSKRVTCLARDLGGNPYFCFSFDPALVEAVRSMSPYSYVAYVYGETGECESIGVSIRSHHIPDSRTEKSKSK